MTDLRSLPLNRAARRALAEENQAEEPSLQPIAQLLLWAKEEGVLTVALPDPQRQMFLDLLEKVVYQENQEGAILELLGEDDPKEANAVALGLLSDRREWKGAAGLASLVADHYLGALQETGAFPI